MKKLLIAAAAASFVFGLVAVEKAPAPEGEKPAETLEEKDDSSLEAGLDVDFFTAYVWRNSVQNDRPVAQPCAWADWTVVDPVYVGFSVWQNYDLTKRRKSTGLPNVREKHLGRYLGSSRKQMHVFEWNENDFNVHAGAALWTSDDENTKLNFEFGHDWYTYHVHGTWGEEDGGYRKRKDWQTTYELYVKLELENEYVTPYAQLSHEYQDIDGTHIEFGLKKEKTLSDLFDSESDLLSQLTLAGDVNVNFGSRRYMTYLYDGDTDNGRTVGNGLGGITAKLGLTWAPCDYFSVGGLLAFTSILGDDARDEFKAFDPWCDDRELVWGGIQAKVSF